MMANSLVSVRNLHKVFQRGGQRIDVLQGVNLDIPQGDYLALMGPSGSGKTTLLNLIGGLDTPTEGSIDVGGDRIDKLSGGKLSAWRARHIGFVFQLYNLLPVLTAARNVELPLLLTKLGKADRRKRVEVALTAVGLADRMNHFPRQLSGGQEQRVALARALAPEPRLLLLDEPLAALDASTKVTIRRELKHHLTRFEGITLLVTHDPIDAAALADTVLVIEEGRVVQGGTIPDITARPRSHYVADLVGVNLMRGHASGGHIAIEGGGTLTAMDGADGDVFAVIHPRNVWSGRITALDQQGDRVRVTVGGAPQMVAEVTPAAVQELHLAEGGEVWVSLKAAEVAVYPA